MDLPQAWQEDPRCDAVHPVCWAAQSCQARVGEKSAGSGRVRGEGGPAGGWGREAPAYIPPGNYIMGHTETLGVTAQQVSLAF